MHLLKIETSLSLGDLDLKVSGQVFFANFVKMITREQSDVGFQNSQLRYIY